MILDRAINGLKRFKERLGAQKYNEIMELLASGHANFNGVIQKMVRKADDVDFFDKLLRDHMITILKNEKKEQEDFLDQVENIRNQINANLHIPKKESILYFMSPLSMRQITVLKVMEKDCGQSWLGSWVLMNMG